MIRTLRRRFLLIALASLTGTLAVLCLVINLGYHAITTRRADQVLQMLHQNAGQFPEPETQADPGAFPGFQVTLETPFETRYVVVRLTGQREVAEVDMEHIAALDREKVIQPVDLSGVVAGQMEDYRLLAQTSGKELESDVAPGVTVRGAADNLKRLCTLLLDNAVKYCDSGGTIRLTLAQRGRWAVLSISNPCAGLDPAQLPRLFDRFYRADASRSRDTGGYGIGLSTARAIVQRHRGRLTAKSEDGLVVFTARLPLT